MPKAPSAALARKIKTDKPVVPEDKLELVREHLRRARETELQLASLSSTVAEKSSEIKLLTSETLPTLFQEIGIDVLGLEADGNLPAYDAKLQPYYSANIAASWDEERKQKAFEWLEDAGHGDMIKNTFSVQLGRGDEKRAIKLRAMLEKAGFEFEERKTVPAPSLTAFVKEQVEKHNTTPPLELLGATVGKIVKLKPRKEN